MDPLAKEYLLTFYSRLLCLHGDTPEALRWTPYGQRLRYALLMDIAPSLEGAKVLDYGCGKGDLMSFLKERKVSVDYTGLDINPDLIRLAQEKHPDGRFRVHDIEEWDLEEDFDFVFICGVFNNRVEGATDAMLSAVSRLFGHARQALALTGISSHSPHRDYEINYVDPADVLRFALSYLTPYASLRHDASQDDFTLFLYKKPRHILPPPQGSAS